MFVWLLYHRHKYEVLKGIYLSLIHIWRQDVCPPYQQRQAYFSIYLFPIQQSPSWKALHDTAPVSYTHLTTLSSWSSNSFFSSIGNFLSLNAKSPSRIDCFYLIWTDSSDRPDITGKNIVFYLTAFPNFTPQSSSYTVVNPSGWQTRKCESVTSIHPRWQNQYI